MVGEEEVSKVKHSLWVLLSEMRKGRRSGEEEILELASVTALSPQRRAMRARAE